MDSLTIEEFLMQIGADFAEFASVFRANGFDTIGSLRCIKIEEDLSEMFKNSNKTLLLGKKRQLQNALENLKDVSPNNTKQDTVQKPGMNKIVEKSTDSIKSLERDLARSEAEYNTMILSEKEKVVGRRCNNCHRTGHKANNNKNNELCSNYPCTSIHFCGQVDKHPEYVLEKKKKQKEINQIKQKINKVKEEKTNLERFIDNKKTNFMSAMRERVRNTNPHKYRDGAKLMKDIHLLKVAYNNVIPDNTGNDCYEFKQHLERMTNKVSQDGFIPQKRKYEDSVNDPGSNTSFTQQPSQYFPMPYFPNPWQFPPYFPPVDINTTRMPFQVPTLPLQHPAPNPSQPAVLKMESTTPKPDVVKTEPSSMDLLADAALKDYKLEECTETDFDADDESD